MAGALPPGFVAANHVRLRLPVRPGPNRVEAVLVDAPSGEAGLWRFALLSGRLQVGSLRSLSGDPLALGPGLVAFSLRGLPGERVVFAFVVE